MFGFFQTSIYKFTDFKLVLGGLCLIYQQFYPVYFFIFHFVKLRKRKGEDFPYMAQVFLTCAHAHTEMRTIPTTGFGSNTTSQLKPDIYRNKK